MVELDSSGMVSIMPSDIDDGSTDNCMVDSLSLDNNMFDCNNIGSNTVVLTVYDANGNSSTCSATVTVKDNTAPTLWSI